MSNIPWTGHTLLGFSLAYTDKGKFRELSKKLGVWAIHEADHCKLHCIKLPIQHWTSLPCFLIG